MSAIQRISERYSIPAKRGGRVRYTGGESVKTGTITSARDGYLRIRLDGENQPRSYHPTWELEYL